ncbi:pectinesterase family protein [Viridibacterium curvum]|uniref:Pectinesterase n=1 Tax=Viridibacterium curvum TaxID=1101404 RepID=A0ABP9QWC7_9RHOO
MKKPIVKLSLAVLSALVLGACATSLEGPVAASTAKRPQLTVEKAAQHTMANYFAQGGMIDAPTNDPWDPVKNGIGDVSKFKPTYTVAADGSGTHKTVQAAVDAITAKGGTERVYVLVKPGTYREQVCLKETAPVTIYGESSDASKVLIVGNIGAGSKKDKEVTANACEGRKGADTYGTSGSSTFLAYSDGFQAKNITVSNDYDESPSPKSGTQAVALNTRGDKVILENVRLLGEQDTVMFKSKDMGLINRVFVTNSYIEGDVDFVFGRAVVVFDKVEFKSLTTRGGAEGGFVFAPSQPNNFPFGYLVTNSKFTSDGNKAGKTLHLGRSWDEGAAPLVTKDGGKHYPNGMVVIRNSYIGEHIAKEAPWAAAASTNRPFDSEKEQTIQFGNPKVPTVYPVNRMFEFRNSGPGAAAK